jgi:hypothetical protein
MISSPLQVAACLYVIIGVLTVGIIVFRGMKVRRYQREQKWLVNEQMKFV